APFAATLQANMRHGGALRLDHVMALRRLFWIPRAAASAAEGGYVRYPFDDLLGILALESQRNRCLVIGEDLGTVPDEVRSPLQLRRIFSYRLLDFERDEQADFLPPAKYPQQALVAASTHDLATLTGYWKGRDLELRTELDLFPSEDYRRSQLIGRA